AARDPDDLDCIEQELLLDRRVRAPARGLHGVEDGLRDLAQVAGVGVDERELPLEPDRRALRARERDRGPPGQRGAHRGPSWRASSPGGASGGSTTSTCREPPTRVSTIVARGSP